MSFLEFLSYWKKHPVMSRHQILLWRPGFDFNNLTRWIAKGQVVRLRNGWFALSQALEEREMDRVAAGRIYYPSYISLEYALSAYDIIPEAVFDITSVTTKKTNRFDNALGNFFYYSVKPALMFGYKPVETLAGCHYLMAYPEKALLDMLYLHPEYRTRQDMEDLRFNEDFMREDLDLARFEDYLGRIGSPSLSKRVNLLLKTYI